MNRTPRPPSASLRPSGDRRQARRKVRGARCVAAGHGIEVRSRGETRRQACGVSERTLTRRFTAATGLTPLRYQQVLRMERAEHLIGHGTAVEAAARAVGFSDARMLRRLRAREAAL